MEFKVFDTVKGLALVVVLVFIWHYGSQYLKHITKPAPPAPVVERIDENAIKLAAITASNEMANKMKAEFEARESQLIAAYEEARRDTGEVLDELGSVKIKLAQQRDLINRLSDHTYVNEKRPKLTQDFKKIYRTDPDGNRYPVAWVIYYPFQTEDKRWKTGLYHLENTVEVVETQNPNGTFNRYAEAYVENNQMKETRGKRFKLPIADVRWAKYEKKDKSMFWWNPRLALGAAFTTEDIAAQLNLSLSSYGKTTGDMDWRFFTFGAGGTKNGDEWIGVFSLEPFSWNMGKPIPLIDNLFVGPIITIDTESKTGYGLQISVPF